MSTEILKNAGKVALVNFIIGVITLVQPMVLTWPLTPLGITILSGSLLLVANILMAVKQYLSVEVNMKAVSFTMLVLIITSLGAINEFFQILPMKPLAAQWTRIIITLLILILTLASKYLFPTDDTRSKFLG